MNAPPEGSDTSEEVGLLCRARNSAFPCVRKRKEEGKKRKEEAISQSERTQAVSCHPQFEF